MRKKNVLVMLFLALGSIAFAQENPLDKKIQTYSEKIEQIVKSEKMKMNEEIQELEKQKENGTLSASEFNEKKQEIALKYERSMNEKIDAEREKLDSITQETVNDAVFDRDQEKKEEKNPLEKTKSGGLAFSFGFLNTSPDAGSFSFFEKNDEVKLGKAVSTSLDLFADRQVGKRSSPLYFRYGLGYRADGFVANKPMVFAQDGTHLFLENFDGGSIHKNRTSVNIQYLQIPLEFIYILNPKYGEHEGTKYLKNSQKYLRIGLGVYGGYRIGNKINYRYSNEISGKNFFTQKVENGINPFLFGGKFSIGYRGLNVFVKKDFTATFDDKALLDNKYGLQFGLELANFQF